MQRVNEKIQNKMAIVHYNTFVGDLLGLATTVSLSPLCISSASATSTKVLHLWDHR